MTTLAAHLLQALLVLLLQSTVLLLLGLLALHLTRKRGPSMQSLVGRASLASVALLVLLLPLTGHVSPVVQVEPTPLQAVIRSNPLADTLPEWEGEELKANAGVPLAAPADSPAQRIALADSTSTPPAPTPPAAPTPRLPAPGGQALVLGGFLCVSALLLLWLGVCQGHLTRLRRTAQVITTSQAVTLLAELTPSPPRLLAHPSVHSPFLAGYHHPVIFLPAAFETDFDADALRAIFVHELTHRDRRDNLWTLAARLLTALLWPQPLLWLLVRRLEHLSEDACDEAVLTSNCPPRAYADCLLSLATRPPLTPRQRTLNAGVAPFRSSVGRRISRILSNKGVRPMSHITPRLRLTAAALTVAAALGGAFLISSAPAQTQPKPAPMVTSAITGIWMLKSSSNGDIIVIGPQGDAASIENGGLRCRYFRYTISGPTLVITHTRTADNGHVVSDTAGQQTSAGTYSTADDILTIHTQHSTDIAQRVSTYPKSIPLETVVAQQADLSISALRWRRSSELSQDQFLAGLTPVQGPGVVVTFQDVEGTAFPLNMTPANVVHAMTINTFINELKAAGAEAITVNNQRLVATSSVRAAGAILLANDTPIATPFIIRAIGDSKTLAAAMNQSDPRSGVADAKNDSPIKVSVVQDAALTLPAYQSTSLPLYAHIAP